MKVSRVGIALAALVVCNSVAQAQDRRSSNDLPPYASGPSWTGFYLGAAFGGGVAVEHTNSTINGVTFSDQGTGGRAYLTASTT
jgi:hypothetical protein